MTANELVQQKAKEIPVASIERGGSPLSEEGANSFPNLNGEIFNGSVAVPHISEAEHVQPPEVSLELPVQANGDGARLQPLGLFWSLIPGSVTKSGDWERQVMARLQAMSRHEGHGSPAISQVEAKVAPGSVSAGPAVQPAGDSVDQPTAAESSYEPWLAKAIEIVRQETGEGVRFDPGTEANLREAGVPPVAKIAMMETIGAYIEAIPFSRN